MTKAQLLALRDRLYLHDEIPEARPRRRPPPLLPARARLDRRPSTWPSGAGPSAARCPGGSVRARPLRPPDAGRPSPTCRPAPAARRCRPPWRFARLLRSLVRDPSIGRRIVPIVSDEARTFGLESLISEVQIYAPDGQRYTPVDAGLALHYAESATGQVLQEGITEAGAAATFTAAATSYATWGEPMIPFYLFYSMFGFQRVGDLLWALGDSRGRGFLLGCTAGRTTLNGEGLQHQDGHSLLLASPCPSVAAYDPAFAYEVAAIVEDGIRRMTGPEPEDRFWYLTLYNENYPMPALPPDPAGGRAGPGGDRPGHVPLRRPPMTAPVERLAAGRPPSCSRARPGERPSRPSGCWPRTGTSTPRPGR